MLRLSGLQLYFCSWCMSASMANVCTHAGRCGRLMQPLNSQPQRQNQQPRHQEQEEEQRQTAQQALTRVFASEYHGAKGTTASKQRERSVSVGRASLVQCDKRQHHQTGLVGTAAVTVCGVTKSTSAASRAGSSKATYTVNKETDDSVQHLKVNARRAVVISRAPVVDWTASANNDWTNRAPSPFNLSTYTSTITSGSKNCTSRSSSVVSAAGAESVVHGRPVVTSTPSRYDGSALSWTVLAALSVLWLGCCLVVPCQAPVPLPTRGYDPPAASNTVASQLSTSQPVSDHETLPSTKEAALLAIPTSAGELAALNPRDSQGALPGRAVPSTDHCREATRSDLSNSGQEGSQAANNLGTVTELMDSEVQSRAFHSEPNVEGQGSMRAVPHEPHRDDDDTRASHPSTQADVLPAASGSKTSPRVTHASDDVSDDEDLTLSSEGSGIFLKGDSAAQTARLLYVLADSLAERSSSVRPTCCDVGKMAADHRLHCNPKYHLEALWAWPTSGEAKSRVASLKQSHAIFLDRVQQLPVDQDALRTNQLPVRSDKISRTQYSSHAGGDLHENHFSPVMDAYQSQIFLSTEAPQNQFAPRADLLRPYRLTPGAAARASLRLQAVDDEALPSEWSFRLAHDIAWCARERPLLFYKCCYGVASTQNDKLRLFHHRKSRSRHDSGRLIPWSSTNR